MKIDRVILGRATYPCKIVFTSYEGFELKVTCLHSVQALEASRDNLAVV